MLLEFGDSSNNEGEAKKMGVITLECCGVLVGIKAQEIVDHIDASWRRGQEAVMPDSTGGFG